MTWTVARLAKVKREFLALLAKGATITKAAKMVGSGRSTMYELRNDDEAFRAAWDEAVDVGIELLEEEARRRAVEGVERPLVSGGRMFTTADGDPVMIREYSDSLLALMLKAKRPKEYRDRQDVNLGGSINISFSGGDSEL